METDLSFHIQKYIYNHQTILMVSWWGRDSYFNNKTNQTRDVVLRNAIYGSLGSF